MIGKILVAIISFILSLFKPKKTTNFVQKHYKHWYTKKDIMSVAEQRFYVMLKEILGDTYIVCPQINLASIINKNGKRGFQNELYRNVDFGIFSKVDYKLLLLIELNDETHNIATRRRRDQSVKSICDEARINLISFWLSKPNEREYVSNRIMQYLIPSDSGINNNYNIPINN